MALDYIEARLDAATQNIDEKIRSQIVNKVPYGKAYFYDEEGSKIAEAFCGKEVGELPEGTAKIISNGNLNIEEIGSNIEVVAHGNVTVGAAHDNSSITSDGNIKIEQNGKKLKLQAKGDVALHSINISEITTVGNIVAETAVNDNTILGERNNIVAGKAILIKDERAVLGGNVEAKDSIVTAFIAPFANIDTPNLSVLEGHPIPYPEMNRNQNADLLKVATYITSSNWKSNVDEAHMKLLLEANCNVKLPYRDTQHTNQCLNRYGNMKSSALPEM